VKSTNYYRALTKRWWILALGLVLGVALAAVTQPSTADLARSKKTYVWYKATNTVLLTTERSVPPVDYGRLILYATKGEVPQTVEQALGAKQAPKVQEGSPNPASSNDSSSSSSSSNSSKKTKTNSLQAFADASTVKLVYKGFTYVVITPNRGNGSVSVTAINGNKDVAANVANLYSKKLSDFLVASGQNDYDAKLKALQSQRAASEAKLQSLVAQAQVAALTGAANASVVNAQRDSENRKLSGINAQINTLTVSGPNNLTITELEKASPDRVDLTYVQSGSEPPSGWMRVAMGASIGLLLALALVVLLEVLAARVRDVRAIENAAKLPVVAEIPVVDFDRRNMYPVAIADDPASVSAEAYRTMRTALLASWRRHPVHSVVGASDADLPGPAGNGHGDGFDDDAGLQALLVTSPGPAEGKSVSVANLAAALAETGLSVVAVDADFRRPTLHRYLGANAEPDLVTLGRNCTPETVQAALQNTRIPGVRLLAIKHRSKAPGEAVAVIRSVVTAARGLADIVIVDSPPLLLANDSVEIATAVDGTLLLARSGWTRRGAITAAADLLRRVGATVIGIGLVGAERGARYGYYGGYAGYGYGPQGYYSYGSYGSSGRRPPTVIVRVMPWKSSRARRKERASAIDIRNDSGPADSLLPTVPAGGPDVDDGDDWLV
jgi:Mrp family chromosome partitioning ATPase/capsular polysaccharide biosynthesis protein